MTFVHNFDKYIAGYIAHIPKSVHDVMKYISVIGGSIFAISTILVIGAVAVATNNNEMLAMTSLVLVATPLAEASKFITRRKRPETLYAESMKFKSYSFPSGHSYVSALMASFITYLALTHIDSVLGLIVSALFIGLSFVVGLSRIYLGAHFPSDVFAGWSLGFIVFCVVANVTTKLV